MSDQNGRPPQRMGSIDDYGVYDDAKTYYTADDRHMNSRAGPRTRTYSQVSKRHHSQTSDDILVLARSNG